MASGTGGPSSVRPRESGAPENRGFRRATGFPLAREKPAFSGILDRTHLRSPPADTTSVTAAHRDEGEVGIAEEMLADRAVLLEQIEARAAFLALAERDRVHYRIDADEL